MSTITVEHVARIEGHGTIAVDIRDGAVADVRMEIVEPARFFESMVVGRPCEDVSLITSRICGICSPNHAITSLKAIEVALDIEVSERTVLLRKLLVYGSYLQNHATHLYLFAAPDYVGMPSVFPLAETHPHVVERALRIKRIGNELTTVVGGRPVHPVTAVIGGFTSEPDAESLARIRRVLEGALDDAVETAKLFQALEVPEFATSGDMLALYADDDYAIYEGDIRSLIGEWTRPVSSYREVIRESVATHSNAKHSTVDGRTFMVGALPRIRLSADRLMPRAAESLAASGMEPQSLNSFHNNLCQAIELVDACERCIDYIDRLGGMGGSSVPAAYELKAGAGVGATEAPRGTVYHAYALDENGRVTSGDIITPTAQNLANLEADMRAFAPRFVGGTDEEVLFEMERLVRAYDPCLSCSVH